MTMSRHVAIAVLAWFALAVIAVQPASAQSLTASDMNFAFGGAPTPTPRAAQAPAPRTEPLPALPAVTAVEPVTLASARPMTQDEMRETQGAAAPLVGLVAWNGARYVVTRWVAPRVAVSALRSGCSVWCRNSQQAGALARQAFGSNNVIRHGPSHHVRSPIHFSHFQANRGFQGSHVFYGRPLR